MQCHYKHIKVLIYRLLIILLAFSLTRVYFFISNYGQFNDESSREILTSFFVGIRFDWAVVIAFNFIFIFLNLIPGNFQSNKLFQKILKHLYVIINTLILLANIADAEFFKFTQKRATFDIFKTEGGDFFNLLPKYLIDYWYTFIAAAILFLILWKFYPKTKCESQKPITLKYYFFQSIISLILVIVFFVCYRGVGHRPASITTAAKYVSIHNVPLVLNTPYTLIQTTDKQSIKVKEYFTEEQLNKIYNPVKEYSYDSINKKNVIIIILESFGKEYSALYGNNKGYTPFLDSLSKHSLYFKYSFANGKRSMEAVSSVIGSIPSLTNIPFLVSQFSSNYTQALATILSKEGYQTVFFHGGKNGTMDFDNYASIAGFDKYYGKNEYNNNDDYDGNWGIFDEPYLQYFAKTINNFKEPFFTTLFTLSSHHPYTIPKKYYNKLPKGSHPIYESVAYADISLRNFFKTAQKMPWYNNTLFVLTADHTSIANSKYYKNELGRYAIPIIFYSPSDTTLKYNSNEIAQQIDIMPSILDYLNYNKPFFAFGSSVFNKVEPHFSINFLGSSYQFAYKNYFLLYSNEKIQKVYNFKTDSLLKIDIKDTVKIANNLNLLKAIIQKYNNGMVENKLSLSQ